MMKVFLLMVVLVGLAGCAYQPRSYQTAMPLPARLVVDESRVGDVNDEERWWQTFGLVQLEQLMQELDVNSLDLLTASARIDRAMAQLGIVNSGDWLAVDGRLRHRLNRDFDDSVTQRSDSASLSASYEWDLWGVREAKQVAARLNIDAVNLSKRSIRLSLQSELASAVIRQLALLEQRHISEQNLLASEKLLALLEFKFESGGISGIEVRQQQNTLLSSQLNLLEIKQDLGLNQRFIAALLGRSAMQVEIAAVPLTSFHLPKLRAQQPASRLLSRPDVLLADTQLKISDSELYQAEKAAYPRLSFAGELSLDDLVDLSSGLSAGLSHLLSMPLFDAGRIERQIDVSQADAQLSLLNYRKVTQSAIQDSLDSLDTYFFQQANLDLVEQELANNRALYELAQVRFAAGETDFINLLNAQRSWFNARLKSVNQRHLAYFSAIDVYRALAGSPALDSAGVLPRSSG